MERNPVDGGGDYTKFLTTFQPLNILLATSGQQQPAQSASYFVFYHMAIIANIYMKNN
jgi:hypothetical protein